MIKKVKQKPKLKATKSSSKKPKLTKMATKKHSNKLTSKAIKATKKIIKTKRAPNGTTKVRARLPVDKILGLMLKQPFILRINGEVVYE